jgi:hypothetical protein
MPITRLATTILLSALALAATVRASWLELQPAYYTDLEIGTARLEGGANLNPALALYGFVDFYGQTNREYALNTYYGEARLMQSLDFVSPDLKAWNLTVEANGGTDYAGIARFGVVWNTSLWKDNTFALKLYPAASRDHDAQVSFYCAQQFTPNFSAYAIFDYDFGDWIFGEEQIYVELEVRYRLNKKFSLFAQGRQFAPAAGFQLDPTPVIGLKYTF